MTSKVMKLSLTLPVGINDCSPAPSAVLVSLPQHCTVYFHRSKLFTHLVPSLNGKPLQGKSLSHLGPCHSIMFVNEWAWERIRNAESQASPRPMESDSSFSKIPSALHA